MQVNKPHLEFHRIDMAGGWETPAGYPAGIEQKILAGTLDETSKGRQPHPAAALSARHLHDRAVRPRLLGRGVPSLGRPHRRQRRRKATAARISRPGTYACRPPGAAHGPFKSNGGCLLIESHYYPD